MSKKPESQTTKILNHLLTGSEITSWEAFKYFGCTRLAARIKEISDSGYLVTRNQVERNGKHFTAYSIPQ